MIEAQIRSGEWTDPERGNVKLADYATAWITERPGLRPPHRRPVSVATREAHRPAPRRNTGREAVHQDGPGMAGRAPCQWRICLGDGQGLSPAARRPDHCGGGRQAPPPQPVPDPRRPGGEGCGSFSVSPVPGRPGSCLLSPGPGRLIRAGRAGRAVPARAARGRRGSHRNATSTRSWRPQSHIDVAARGRCRVAGGRSGGWRTGPADRAGGNTGRPGSQRPPGRSHERSRTRRRTPPNGRS